MSGLAANPLPIVGCAGTVGVVVLIVGVAEVEDDVGDGREVRLNWGLVRSSRSI